MNKSTQETGRILRWSLGSYQDAVELGLQRLRDGEIIKRIWAHDHTVWKPEPAEITNRLGWLHSVGVMSGNTERLTALADEVRSEGYSRLFLLGMGGSSLAPDVFGSTFGRRSGYPDLTVLDSTDPGAVSACADQSDAAQSLFIVATKSGTTVETCSFLKFFYNRIAGAVGDEEAGRHFIAITDPNTPLADLAERYRFRATFLNDPDIGGRYSALSCFGLVPAALIGLDLKTLLDRAASVASESTFPAAEAAALGVTLGELALAGRNKLTLVTSPELEPFGAWIEQLIAESTGKEGKGILPVTGEAPGTAEVYGNDRLFVQLILGKDRRGDTRLSHLDQAGHPVVTVTLDDLYDLGGQFFFWEMATVVAGWCMGINPFDQPDVESSKGLARRMVDEYRDTGVLAGEEPTLTEGDVTVFGGPAAQGACNSMLSFIEGGMTDGAYIAIQAFLQPGPACDQALRLLRTRLRDRFGVAVTVGYGPRFLHSTGQLHKGDAGKGMFIQLTADNTTDVPIPDHIGSRTASVTFGILKEAQAGGDRNALRGAGRRVMRLHLERDPVDPLIRLAEALK